MSEKEDKESGTVDYKEDAGFPTQRPFGPLRKGPKIIRPIPLDDDFVVIERPRSPSPPVVVEKDGKEARSNPNAADDAKERRPKKPAARVKFAQQNDIRVFKEDESKSISGEGQEDVGDISKEGTMNEERNS